MKRRCAAVQSPLPTTSATLASSALRAALADIRPEDLARKLKNLTRSEFNHRLACAKTFFTWAQKKRYITDNPTGGFTPYTIASRSRVLTDPELKAVWEAAEHVDDHFGTIVRLLILTGMRRGECAAIQAVMDTQARRSRFRRKPRKTDREHAFPIAALVTSMLADSLCRRTAGAYYSPRAESLRRHLTVGQSANSHSTAGLTSHRGRCTTSEGRLLPTSLRWE